jgi:hypothetical protein
MALKLNQVIALSKTAKAVGEDGLTQAYHNVSKLQPMSGISRTYQPRDDDGETLPPESTRLQVRVSDLLASAARAVERQIDIVATLDVGNQLAVADVVVDGNRLLTNVPVTTLLFLEKKVTSLVDVIKKLPVLDAGETWTFDEGQDAYSTAPVQTVRTKKVPRNHVRAEATDKHPAQVEVWYEDITVGYWNTVKYSGAVTAKQKAEMLERAQKLAAAVKVAREEANGIEVADRKIGAAIFSYLGW